MTDNANNDANDRAREWAAKAIKAMGPTDLILETEKMVKALEARGSKDFDLFLLGECAKALIRTLFNHMEEYDPLGR